MIDVVKSNEIIAKYMGGKYGTKEHPLKWVFSVQPTTYYRPDATHIHLNYHFDWNWLMNVVHKIVKDFGGLELIEIPVFSSIDLVYEAVVKCILKHSSIEEQAI